ncbi:MAG: pullulanase-type alpha-1,6-glucosidase [Anaeromyxobacter sp.]
MRESKHASRARLAALTLLALPALAAAQASVTVAGSLQSELGCPGDWQPECTATQLLLDPGDGVWQGLFAVPAGDWEYKAALDGTWDVNYGAHAAPNGPNIPLSLASPAMVKFYFDPVSHWIADDHDDVIAVAPGDFQSELGCPGDWQPDCLRSWLQDPDGDGIYSFSTSALPAGDYQVKVAIGESWSENYGAGGVANGANIPFTVPADCSTVTFTYDGATHVLTVDTGTAPVVQPASVTIAGSLQSEVGCAGDWDPACAASGLTFDAADGVWQGTFTVPAGPWEYKAALNGSWDLNYGANATPNGANLAFTQAAAGPVKFYFDAATHWVTSDRNAVIATVPGSFQSELGCPGDWQPDCLRSWLQDPDGDGIYTFTTTRLPAGAYEAKVAIGESWDENYGAGGAPGGANIAFVVPAACTPMTFSYDATTHVLAISAGGTLPGSLGTARAHWVAPDLIAWDVGGAPPGTVFRLHTDPAGGLDLAPDGVSGGYAWDLTLDPAGLPADVKARFPHLAAFAALRLPADAVAAAPDILRGEMAVSAARDGVRVDATALQIPGVLDALYTYRGALGPTFARGVPTLRLWAPTARSVKLHLFDGPEDGATETVVPMAIDGATGTWTVQGTAAWRWKYYLYEVEVFVRSEDQVMTNLVTDPYALALSRNSLRSQLVDLSDPFLAPPGWQTLPKPRLAAPSDIVLYELHVRDFSAADRTVPTAMRGTFLAFTVPGSAGMQHLRKLAQAGLTHVHLLPAFDFATVNEDRSTWQRPDCALASFPPDSQAQQACVSAVRQADAFNWGYDPLHYTVPEGSYALFPDGGMRTWEFRAMVQALNRTGLRVVMDVVYNHTSASGQAPQSVLDRIVPGYYHRLDADGFVATSTCCQNTATEHAMMEKLMVDSVVTWAKAYKVDGFRFDLMGHHMKANMLAVRAALDALTLARDGVDGSKVYVYGEGWNFGEVADDARGVNATQLNMAGTGIGTFSDRLRDRVRGGGPFSPLRDQGYATGLALEPNGSSQGTAAEQAARLLAYSDLIRLGLAGNLAHYTLVDAAGAPREGSAFDYNGQPAGYALRPDDTICYISAHDNHVWFDALQAKVPAALPLWDRVRMDDLGLSVVALSQGIPFLHAGDELLRSKSGDGNSYDSGDWFNRIDWTGTENTWGSGLPPAGDNQANWPVLAPLLADPALKPGPAEMAFASAHLQEMLRIRRSTPLFRLRTAQAIMDRVRFLNVGPGQIPGLVVMDLVSPAAVEGPFREVVVLFNAAPGTVTYAAPTLAGKKLKLHPVQKDSADGVVRQASFQKATGTFSVPGRTTAVFVIDK